MNLRRVCWLGLPAVLFAVTLTSWLTTYPKWDRRAVSLSSPHTEHKAAETMSGEEIFRYLHWTNSTSCLFAVDFGYWVWNGDGIAAPDGHKAVCLDQYIAPVYNNCLVYSFGINNQWTFDEAMVQYGCQVYSFDPSMPNNQSREDLHFYNLGLSGEETNSDATEWDTKTASSIYQMLEHHPTLIDVLKMDIEFSEWDAIPQMLRSGFLADKVKQLAVEIHFNANDTLETFRRYASILQDLEISGRFVRFSSRPNVGLREQITILEDKEEYIGMELAWYNSRFYYSVANHSQTRFFPYF